MHKAFAQNLLKVFFEDLLKESLLKMIKSNEKHSAAKETHNEVPVNRAELTKNLARAPEVLTHEVAHNPRRFSSCFSLLQFGSTAFQTFD